MSRISVGPATDSNTERATIGFAPSISSDGEMSARVGTPTCGAQMPAWYGSGTGGETLVAEFCQPLPWRPPYSMNHRKADTGFSSEGVPSRSEEHTSELQSR